MREINKNREKMEANYAQAYSLYTLEQILD